MAYDLKDLINREIYAVYKIFKSKEVAKFFITEKEALDFKSSFIDRQTSNIMKRSKVPILKQVAAANYIYPMLNELISINYKKKFVYADETKTPEDLESITTITDSKGVPYIRYKFKDGGLIEFDPTGKFIWKELMVNISKEQYERDVKKAREYLYEGYDANYIKTVILQDKMKNYAGYIVQTSTEPKAKKILEELSKSESKITV